MSFAPQIELIFRVRTPMNAMFRTHPKTPGSWFFRTADQKYDINKVNLDVHIKADITIMVCERIWIGRRYELAIMQRDSASKRNGCISKSYVLVRIRPVFVAKADYCDKLYTPVTQQEV